jgi:transmembrane sensor
VHQIASEAAEWFIANGEDLDEAQRGKFLSWLRASPLHVAEYLKVAQLAGDLRQAAAGHELSIEALIRRARADKGPPHSARPRWLPAMAAAAAMVVAVAGLQLWWNASPTGPRAPRLPAPATALHLATRHGQQLTHRLNDGSVLYLNTDTSVDIQNQPHGLRVEISSGQVLFDVTHHDDRLLEVLAGKTRVIDLGTKFEVYQQTGPTIVTVLEGRVSVNPSTAPEPRLDTPQGLQRPLASLELTAGQQVRVEGSEWRPRVTRVDTRRTAAWLHRQIIFEREPLAQVAAEFNRYNSQSIEIDTRALRELPVSGTLATDDVGSFVAFLRTLDGVSVEVTPTRIRAWKS